ncbi:UNVERIFIED_CONTAM: hypothetical protein ABIC26_003241 [Paenibacillus sp. PvR008]
MKKALLASLGLALLLSTSTAVASAQEAAPALQKEPIQPSSSSWYQDTEPNNWENGDSSNEITVGDGIDIYGSIGKNIPGGYAGYYDTTDVYKFTAPKSGKYRFDIEGGDNIYPNSWLSLSLYEGSENDCIGDSDGRDTYLSKKLEAGKVYYLQVGTPGYEIGQVFYYRVTSTIK